VSGDIVVNLSNVSSHIGLCLDRLREYVYITTYIASLERKKRRKNLRVGIVADNRATTQSFAVRVDCRKTSRIGKFTVRVSGLFLSMRSRSHSQA
jgi:hypothetical protein